MAEFSYASDIAPLRSTFFPASGMSRLQRQQLDTRYARDIEPIDTKTRELQKNMLQMIESEDAFEMQRLQLEEAKRAARMKTETETRLPSLMTEIDSVLGNTALDPNTKAVEVGKLNMKYGALATYNPSIANLLSGANKQVSSLQSIADEEYRKKAAEDQKKLSVISSAVQMGDSDLIRNIVEDKVDLNQAYLALGQRSQEEKDLEDKRKLAQGKLAQEETVRKAQLDMYQNFATILGGIGRKQNEEVDVPSTLAGRSPEQINDAAASETARLSRLSLSEAERIKLEQLWKTLNPAAKVTDIPKDPKKLFEDVTKSTYGGIAKFSYTPSLSPTLSAEESAFSSPPRPTTPRR